MNFQSIPWPSFPHTPSPSWEILFSKSRRRSNIARISVILRGRGGASRRIGDGQGKRGAEWSEANSTGRTRNEYLNRDTRRVLFPSFSFSLSPLPFSTLLQLVCSPNHRPRRCPSLYPCIRLFAPSFLLFFLCFLVQRTTFNCYLFGGGLLLLEDRNVARRNVRSRRKIVSERFRSGNIWEDLFQGCVLVSRRVGQVSRRKVLRLFNSFPSLFFDTSQ